MHAYHENREAERLPHTVIAKLDMAISPITQKMAG
jgi:hypothetical protein